MLVRGYTIRLTDYEGKFITAIHYQNKPTEEDIEKALLKHKKEAMYCEISENYRLHSNTLYQNER
jgi:hypothetical protein